MNSDSKLFDRYLDVLQASREEPSLEALSRVVSAHLIRVPFENVSKVLRKLSGADSVFSTLDEYLSGIEQYGFGGTCYTNNYYLYQLLAHLGYEIKLCGADMEGYAPNIHMVSVVTIDSNEYMVDVGYGAPFWEPIVRSSAESVTVEFGQHKYSLKPQDSAGRSQMEVYRSGELVHGYLANPKSCELADFMPVIEDSFRSEARFMNHLSLSLFGERQSLSIRDFSLVEVNGGSVREQTLRNRAEVTEIVIERFRFPADKVKKALAQLSALDEE
jgi:arylamine N-acetyltransferase